jgi:hypothetical protein
MPTRKTPLILAINDGESPERARKAFMENGFTSLLITDQSRQIARLSSASSPCICISKGICASRLPSIPKARDVQECELSVDYDELQ